MIQNDILWVNENSYLNILNNWKATRSESKLSNKPKQTNKQKSIEETDTTYFPIKIICFIIPLYKEH